MRIEVASYDHPDARRLVDEVQQEYLLRYGEHDSTPMTVEEFAAPRGLFLLGYRGGEAVASGGWRAHDGDEPFFEDGDAELKRMYVVPHARGSGLARAMLAELERSARSAGRRRAILETGTAQPEAIALYESSGYAEISKFGVYRCDGDSRCFGKWL
ncbi:GNAT family N-acetyltransferase [Allosaccharopolyspora coralli]|uniref:GNAT family N-acetyltransferase n=1 Tax=Allosaccharopolyspora coralli TaxID=2665642 RepID=A0A5Q3Q916_9PSEU|nr:GNAT family N-acetyltransferase [Allosaccharopolyspora coralli]QGK71171.1 GNAT family N-acetyltransferase [Allosaccharopolyspora coralli]